MCTVVSLHNLFSEALFNNLSSLFKSPFDQNLIMQLTFKSIHILGLHILDHGFGLHLKYHLNNCIFIKYVF